MAAVAEWLKLVSKAHLGRALVGFVDQNFWHSFYGDGEWYDGVVDGAAGHVTGAVETGALGADQAAVGTWFVSSTGAKVAENCITSLTKQKFLESEWKFSSGNLLPEMLWSNGQIAF